MHTTKIKYNIENNYKSYLYYKYWNVSKIYYIITKFILSSNSSLFLSIIVYHKSEDYDPPNRYTSLSYKVVPNITYKLQTYERVLLLAEQLISCTRFFISDAQSKAISLLIPLSNFYSNIPKWSHNSKKIKKQTFPIYIFPYTNHNNSNSRDLAYEIEPSLPPFLSSNIIPNIPK